MHVTMHKIMHKAMHLKQRDGALDLLKWLALLSMVLDHLRYVGYSADLLYVPGRLAFPWFCLAMAANLARVRTTTTGGQWRYLAWLLLFSAVSEIPYRMFIPNPDTLNVLPTLALGLLVVRGWQQPALASRLLAAGAVLLAAFFSQRLMFGFYGVLLPWVMFLVLRRPWYYALLAGLVCLVANQWQVLYHAARLGNIAAIPAIVTCLIAPWLGLFLLRHAGGVKPPPMRRWAYALYPAHFLVLLAVRQVIA
ncbi:conjugal transfer protein TraX [Pseudomonas fluorescens]|uniref:Conjugal transfer protein TraX n=1 Tax=Pseudomonas fluorescens TaxID=294 RepID=A0A327MZN2_PSEFL|nr:TraX family protein [Pseudomonas fluorescens]RAI67476.1 conjugal transfer protein TraX [Pseudomonas fluorescens]